MGRRFIEDAINQMAPYAKLDSNESAFFVRELEQIEAKTYDILYPDCIARTLMPMGTGLSNAAEYLTWRQFDRQGTAVESESLNTDDLPGVDVVGKEFQSRVVSIVTGYEYNVQEIRAAMMANRPLDAMKAAAARDQVERKLEVMAAEGSVNSSVNNILGLLNAPQVGYACASTDTGGSRVLALRTAAAGSSAAQNAWAAGGKTPKEMIHDVTDAFNYVVTQTNMVHQPNTLLLDIASYSYITTTMVNDADSNIFLDATVEQYMRRMCPWLKEIKPWLQCSSTKLGTKGTAETRAFLYEKNERNFQFFVPQEFEQFAPQLKNFKFSIPCHARCAGVVTRYPKAGIYLDGLQP